MHKRTYCFLVNSSYMLHDDPNTKKYEIVCESILEKQPILFGLAEELMFHRQNEYMQGLAWNS